jgi:hypothetical protein
VETVAVLLAAFSSVWSAVTLTELFAVPLAVGITTIVKSAASPDTSFAMLQVTTRLACEQDPALMLADPKFIPEGSVSVSTTLVASSGP